MELAAPRWRETPSQLLQLIKATNTPAPADNSYARRLLARDDIHQQLSPFRRRIVDYLTQRIRKYIALRENTRQHHVLAFSATRQKLIEMEQQLIRHGLLHITGDIFFLKFAEAQALLHGSLEAEQANLLIRRRRRRWQHQKQVTAPLTINLPVPETATDENADLSGQCASPGQVTGAVRVLTSIDQHSSLQPGEILVAPFTDPAWTPLFVRAAGVVVETGSYLSHAGTLARELHVPCLVDVPQATQQLRTGEHILLDASNGSIVRQTPPATVRQAAV